MGQAINQEEKEAIFGYSEQKADWRAVVHQQLSRDLQMLCQAGGRSTAVPASNAFPLPTTTLIPSEEPSTDHRSCFPTIATGTIESIIVEWLISKDFPTSESQKPFLSYLNMCHFSFS
jgi:hypothetical protein